MCSIKDLRKLVYVMDRKINERIDYDEVKKCEALLPVYAEKLLNIKRNLIHEYSIRQQLLREIEYLTKPLSYKKTYLISLKKTTPDKSADCNSVVCTIADKIKFIQDVQLIGESGQINTQKRFKMILLKPEDTNLHQINQENPSTSQHSQENQDEETSSHKDEQIAKIQKELELTTNRINQFKEKYQTTKGELKIIQYKYDLYSPCFLFEAKVKLEKIE